ncbi:cytochrome c oxidase assembly protein [Sphingobium quisquiliarum]|nr:cytochrome c oxidase assembly protein [Sphingobium quisquiliarum]
MPDQLWASWNLDPMLIVGMAAAAMMMWRASRSPPEGRWAMIAGFGALLIAFVSPLCALTNALFAARTVHHLLLVLVAAPLFALSLAPGSDAGRSPVAALFASTVLLWFWHWPPAYSAALSSTLIYWTMQASLLISATCFWWGVLLSPREPLPALLAILGSMAQMGLLGAVLTFAPTPFYAEHIVSTAAFGLSPRQDQQLAGLIMWVPAMLPYLLLGGLVARRAWRTALSPA